MGLMTILVSGISILQTKYGEPELLKRQFREFLFETDLFEKCSIVEEVILTAAAESYLKGI
jgi:hypothetical protein